jgi:hypothetical protein
LVAWTRAAQEDVEYLSRTQGLIISPSSVASILRGLVVVARRQPLDVATPEGKEQVVGCVLKLLDVVSAHLYEFTTRSDLLDMLTGEALLFCTVGS